MPEETLVASFWRRVGAGCIDAALPGVFFIGAFLVFSLTEAGWTILVALIFLACAFILTLVNGVFLPARYGQTLGCRLLGLRIVNVVEFRSVGIGFFSALVRLVTQYGLSSFFALGYVWYFIDDRTHRMWHDLIAGTIVLPVSVSPPAPFIKRNIFRSLGGLVGGLLGCFLILVPVFALLGAEILFVTLKQAAPHALSTPSKSAVVKELPEDFPASIIVPVKDHIQTITISEFSESKDKKVEIVWKDLPAEPVSAFLAYRDGFELLGFTTTVEYLETGPVLHFIDEKQHASGFVTLVPTEDARHVQSLLMTVQYTP